MELISKWQFCKKCEVDDLKEIRWKKFNISWDKKKSNDRSKVIYESMELFLQEGNRVFVYIPCISMALVPEKFSISSDKITEILKLPISLNNWTLNYLGKDNFPNFRYCEFCLNDYFIFDEIEKLKNLSSGRYKLTSLGFCEYYEITSSYHESWWIDVKIANSTTSNTKTKLSERLFILNIFQLCLLRDYELIK